MSAPVPRPASRADRPAHLRLVEPGRAPSIEELIEAGQTAERQGHRDEARSHYEAALHRLPASESPRAAALLRWIARTHRDDGVLDAAVDCLEAARFLAEALGDEAGIGHAINAQAGVLSSQGDLVEAERLFLLARESALRSGEAQLAAMTAQNLGVIANIRGEFPKALRFYETSLADYRALGMASHVAIALSNIGLLQTDLQRWDEAQRAYEEASQIAVALGDVGTRLMIDANLAELWVAQGAFERARATGEAVLALAARVQDTRAAGEAHKALGIVARETEDFAGAETHFVEAERIAAERQDLLLSAETARERAELHRRQGRNRDTLQCLNRAHRLFSQLSARRDLADVDRRTSRLETEFLEVVRRWGESIESKDRHTQGHCQRVADLACALAVRAGLDARSLFWFRIAALLHDVGKLIIPPEVLNKPGPLSDEEWALVRRHPTAGVEMLQEIDFPWDVLPVVRSHHERWDGRGYPDGLAGEAIPFTARILCVADVYDALTSERSYKRAFPHDEAMEIMRASAGTQFDPSLFAHFELLMHGEGVALAARGGVPALVRGGTPTSVAAVAPAARPAGLDDLTGVLLRRPFLDAAAQALTAHDAAGEPTSLLVIDVDFFKRVNDTHGHLQGDDVLRAVAGVLQRVGGKSACIGRYAGDEFVVFLPGMSAGAAREVGERLRAAVEKTECRLRNGQPGALKVTLSIGIASSPEHGRTVEALFAAADRALYQVKRQGRNAVALVTGADVEHRRGRPNFERFVGREHELRRLAELLEESVRGAPAIVAVRGEAGVGKTTLVRRLVPEIRLRAGSLVVGRCFEADARPPYGPWAEVINAVRQLGIVPPRRWRELAQLVPALAASDSAGRGGAHGAHSAQGTHGGRGAASARGEHAGAAAGDKYVLLHEITEYLRIAAASRPLAVVLDDMQWADSASWDTLEYVLAQLESERLLVCMTMRAEEMPVEVRRRQARLALDRRFHDILLERLSRDELRRWTESVFDYQPLGRELHAFLYQQTEGNPLLGVQVLRTLLEEGALWHTGTRWEWRPVSEFRLPVGVTDLMARRLERLSPKARRVLATAAVIGRRFDLDIALAAGAASQEELLDAVDEGIEAAVLEAQGGGTGAQYAFTHALLADAVRRGVNPRRLRGIHERVAQALETLRPDDVAAIASHYDQAGRQEHAHQFALQAGGRAADVHAHDEATAFFAMAERNAPTPEALAHARLRLAQVAEAVGRYPDAEALCDLVLAWLDTTSEPARVLPVRRMRARLRALQGQPPQQTLAECEALLAEAKAAGLLAEQVALLAMISKEHTRLADWTGAETLARECLAIAETIGDPDLLGEAQLRLAITLIETHPAETLRYLARAMEAFRAARNRPGEARCHIDGGVLHLRLGNLSAAEDEFEIGLDLARAAHAPAFGVVASLNLGVLYMRSGRYAGARELLEEALRLSTSIRNELHRLAALYNLANLAREHGDAVGAFEMYQASLSLARSIGQRDVEAGAQAGVGLAALERGERYVAERSLREATAAIAARDGVWFQGRELIEALQVRVTLLFDVAEAERAFQTSLAVAERHDLYAAAWLVAECAGPLSSAGVAGVLEVVARYEARLEGKGFASLSTRYAAVRRTLEAMG